MAGASDRAVFLEMAKNKAMTVKEIHEVFNVAPGTARTWTKHELIEEVEGSWPPAFRRKNTFSTGDSSVGSSAHVENKNKSSTFKFEVPRPPKEAVEALYAKTIYGESPSYDMTRKFMEADSIPALKRLENDLITMLMLIEYSQNIIKVEEQKLMDEGD